MTHRPVIHDPDDPVLGKTESAPTPARIYIVITTTSNISIIYAVCSTLSRAQIAATAYASRYPDARIRIEEHPLDRGSKAATIDAYDAPSQQEKHQ